MKSKVIIVGSLITIGVISAFGFVNRSTSNKTNCSEPQKDSTNIAFTTIGINGGLFADSNTGSVPDLNLRSQLFYTVQGRSTRANFQQVYSQSITQEKLKIAKSIDDLIDNYPSSWIKNYRLVDITVNIDGKKTKEKSQNNILTKTQQKLLNSVCISSDIVIAVHYDKNNYNNNIETRQMNVSMVVVPEIEAEYVGGYEQMIAYLQENSSDKIAAKKLNYLPQSSISFVVNEQGETENVLLTQSSNDAEIDQLLIELIKKMPKWKPAKNANGLNVKQEFVFNVGQGGC